MGKTQAQIPTANNLSFEQVWAILQETAKRQEEIAKQQEEASKRHEEDSRQIKESQRETDRQIKEINKRFGDYSNRFGEVVEYMIAPNLLEKFQDMGFDFQEASTNHKVRDNKNNISFEIDVFLQNGDIAMLVEIKSKLTVSDINEHILRIEKMRKYADLRGDKRTFLGAVAGVVVPPKVKEITLNQGLYLIEPSGETFNVTPPYNKPKVW